MCRKARDWVESGRLAPVSGATALYCSKPRFSPPSPVAGSRPGGNDRLARVSDADLMERG
jgi:hypothetical protein